MIYRAVYMYSYFDFRQTRCSAFLCRNCLGLTRIVKSPFLLLQVVATEVRFRVKS